MSYLIALTTTTPARCQKENVLAEEFGLVQAESISETSKAQTKIIGYAVRLNGTGWTPSSAYSSLNIDFRYPVEVCCRTTITNDSNFRSPIDWTNSHRR